jgi:5'-deoxynucleotidase YfbR-like HD superfamily hydrolase
MKPDRAWVLLPSGERLDLLAPDPAGWTDRDLAISLSRTYRWGGHSRWELPLSVAQHSLLVLVMRQKMNALQPLSRSKALRELLHDAEEGFLCFDPISPLKPHLGEDFKTVSNRLRAAIATRYALESWDCADYVLHKQADHLAAASEAFHVTGWSREEIRNSLQIRLEPVATDPLPLLEGMQPWEPWPPRTAASLFLAKLSELIRADSDVERPGDMNAVVEREQTIRALAAGFSKLPPGQGRQTAWPLPATA